ncbi:hypothetical protein BZL30_3601 [Mycobacterium kansasii]|uniref:Uncharacterized protein n=1 Tax=Mycobacterium kansasii TaxID=1768 RepID=A0A1V3XAT5_MYCKA|nr:hypothetical protein BZL30_3601 [Mycobacterium kansasii]
MRGVDQRPIPTSAGETPPGCSRGPADTDPALRRAAYHGDDLPEPLTAYMGKLRRHAYRVLDGDIERMRGQAIPRSRYSR